MIRKACPMLSESLCVIAAIDSELEYQNGLSSARGYNPRVDEVDHGVAGQLVTLERYTRKAMDAWTDSAGEDEALHMLRKIAGIATRALILYGHSARLRNGDNSPIEREAVS